MGQLTHNRRPTQNQKGYYFKIDPSRSIIIINTVLCTLSGGRPFRQSSAASDALSGLPAAAGPAAVSAN